MTIDPGRFDLGDRVRVIGEPHMPGQSEGKIALIGGTAYGVVFEGTDEIHKWYVASELGHGAPSKGDTMTDPAKRQVRARRRMPEATGLSMGGYGGTSDTALGSVTPRGGDRATQAAAAVPRARRPEPTGNMTGAEFGRAGATSSTSLGARFDATRGGLASVTARRRRR